MTITHLYLLLMNFNFIQYEMCYFYCAMIQLSIVYSAASLKCEQSLNLFPAFLLTPCCCLSDALRSPLLLIRRPHCVAGNLSSSACLLPAGLKDQALRVSSAPLLYFHWCYFFFFCCCCLWVITTSETPVVFLLCPALPRSGCAPGALRVYERTGAAVGYDQRGGGGRRGTGVEITAGKGVEVQGM